MRNNIEPAADCPGTLSTAERKGPALSAPAAGKAKALHDYFEEPGDPLKLSLADTLIELAATLGGILAMFFLVIRLVEVLHGGALP
jgi:hypothetical protein